MSIFDDGLLLDGSEPDAWDETSAPWGLCDGCESPNVGPDDCAVCAPRVALKDGIWASVTVDANGQCAWSGWSSDEIALLLLEHTP